LCCGFVGEAKTLHVEIELDDVGGFTSESVN
jgi:hypothetical protein